MFRRPAWTITFRSEAAWDRATGRASRDATRRNSSRSSRRRTRRPEPNRAIPGETENRAKLSGAGREARRRPHARLLRPQLSLPILSEPPYVPPLKSPATARIEQWVTLLVLAVLVGGCYLVLQPFLTAVILAIILCCATWPVFTRLQRFSWSGATLAALLVTLLVALVLLAPFVIVGISLAQNVNELLEHGKRLIDEG